MPSLNDLLGKARLPTPSGIANDLRNQIKGSVKSTSDAIKNAPAAIVRGAVNSATGAVNSAVQAGLADVRGAVNQALHGDFSGALSTLAQGPQDVLGSFGSAFGLSAGGSGAHLNPSQVNPLTGALGRPDPMLSFQWYCELPSITPLGGSPTNLDWSFVEEANIPFRAFETRSIYAQGRMQHFASTYSVEALRLNFYADIENKALKYLLAWQNAILAPFNSTDLTKGGGFGRPSEYRRPIRIYLVDQQRALIVTFEYIHCWPTNLDSLHLDSQSSNRLTYNVTFSVGDVFATAMGINNNAFGAQLTKGLQSLASNALTGVVTNILF